jgi:hypothetical protein
MAVPDKLTCITCELELPRDNFDTDAVYRRKKIPPKCKVCRARKRADLHVCTVCLEPKPRNAFGNGRLGQQTTKPLVCLICKPPMANHGGGRPATRAPGRSFYPCAKCRKDLPPEKFRITNRGHLHSYCRACDHAQRTAWNRRHLKVSKEVKMRTRTGLGSLRGKRSEAVVEDYQFARDQLGMTRDQAVRWVCDAYEIDPEYFTEKLLPRKGVTC